MSARRVVYRSLSMKSRWFSAIRYVTEVGVYYENVVYFERWDDAIAYAMGQGRAA